MKLKPLGDRLIVKPSDEEETTASGIVLPDTAKEKPQKGKVVAVGDGRWDEDGEKRIPLDVAEGDEVLYSKYGGTEITVEDEELLVLKESDVLAKVS
jgi:chaperonin GroES